jgi:hypothetical protein
MRPAPDDRAPTELPEVRQQKIEHGPVSLVEVRARAVELKTGAACSSGVEPQAHHVLDTERPVGLLIEAEVVILAARQEV